MGCFIPSAANVQVSRQIEVCQQSQHSILIPVARFSFRGSKDLVCFIVSSGSALFFLCKGSHAIS